jgi:DNA-binding response OmpR family regulator
MKKRALSVGNCSMDESSLRRTLERHFGAELLAVDSAEEAISLLRNEKFDLVLVNRIFDRNGDLGMVLIERMKADSALAAQPVMLISNYPEFQDQATQLGAAPGVGKSTLSTKESLARLGAFLSPDIG